MSIDMFPDSAVDYLITNSPGGDMTDQTDDRVMPEDLPLVVAVEYANEPVEPGLLLVPGTDPFILFQMKQEGGAIVLDVTASQIEGEDDLIETLEVFFETMLAEREVRKMAALGVIEGDGDPEPDGSDCVEVLPRG